MNGEDGKNDNDQEPEIHQNPGYNDFIVTFIEFRKALKEAHKDTGLKELEPINEIELFRTWFLAKTERDFLKVELEGRIPNDDDDDDDDSFLV